jgi:hypothetical protein
MTTAELTLYKGYTIAIDYDSDPDNPRSWDNLGTMVCFHRRYSLGDSFKLDMDDYGSWSEVRDYIESELGAMVILPLYLYDHGGISMSAGSFRGIAPHAGWDSGQVGFIYCTDGDMVRDGVKTLEEAEDILRNEVKIYDKYLRGDFYTYRITKAETCEACNHTSENFEDSVGGWSEADDAMKEAMQVIDYLSSKGDN